jgi:hypothetical protein
MTRLGFIGMAVVLTGCSALGDASLRGPEDPFFGEDAGGEGGIISNPDSGAGDASKYIGNKLCGATVFTCFPDEEVPKLCGGPSKDGGAMADGGMTMSGMACRVDPKGTGPLCEPIGPNMIKNEGDSCTSASDCGPGFECVGSPSRCRHYCCNADTCTAYSKQNNNKAYFCDIQPLALQSSQMVPVCQPVMPCNLQTQDCGQGQTCAIVESNGSLTTSCVAVGPGQVGEPCDEQHCGLNLQCIGAPMPTCHQLCDPQKPQCPMGTMCFNQWPVLSQQGVGVCKEP